MGDGGSGAFEEGAHEDFVFGAGHAFLLTDLAGGEEVSEGVVHGDHAEVFTGLHDAIEHEGFAFANAVGDGGVVDEDFEGHGAAVAVGAGDELLGDDAAEGFGDHDADLLALIDGEDVEDTVQGARGVAGMEGAENQVTSFGSGDGEGDGFEVAHFTDHDDVGVLTERATKSGGEGFGVGVDFALVDVAAFGFEDEFDGVFEGDDVVLALFIDFVDEGGEGGGLAATDGAGDEDEAVVVADEGADSVGEAEFVNGADAARDDAEGHVDAEALLDDGGAEAAVGGRVGEVDIALGFELIDLGFGQELVGEAAAVFGGEDGGVVPDGLEVAIATPDGLGSGGEVEVGGVVFLAEAEVVID